jgi:hypothetical protein
MSTELKVSAIWFNHSLIDAKIVVKR